MQCMVRARQFNCCSAKALNVTSPELWPLPPTATAKRWTQLITRFRKTYSSVSINYKCTVLNKSNTGCQTMVELRQFSIWPKMRFACFRVLRYCRCITLCLKKVPTFKHRRYQNLWMKNKGRGDEKMHSVCIFFHICRKFEFLISQGNVATCLRWGR